MESLFKARALYDFDGEPNSAELSIRTNDVLTILRVNVGEGWWEGKNASGRTGLFPEAYVERLNDSVPPPSIPAPMPPQNNNTLDEQDDWDNEWDEDNDMYEPVKDTRRESHYSNDNFENVPSGLQRNASYNKPYDQDDNRSESSYNVDAKGTISKKSLNKFTIYTKPLENYLLGNTGGTANTVFKIYRDERFIGVWEELKDAYTVQITSPKKSTKMAGLKSFIAYQLTPSFSNIEVSRRYKHFDWLHARLCDKFTVIAVPPLPDKQISGRYEEQFIEHRRLQLQEFINYVCRHPVLSRCDVWHHFLTCTDEKQWKKGKREAEKDQLVGANFCLAIEAPDKELLSSDLSKIDDNINYINKLDQNIKKLISTCTDQQAKCSSMFKREFHRIGDSFFALGACLDLDSKLPSATASEVQHIATAYMTIGKYYEEQSKDHWKALYDKLYLYKGLTSCLPDILSLQKSSEAKKREYERTLPDPTQIAAMRRKGDVLSYAVFSELNHFQNERSTDLRMAMRCMLEDQIKFYKNIVRELENTLGKFD